MPRSKSKARQSLLLPSGDDSFLLDSHMDMNIGDVSMDSLADIPPTPLPSRLQNEERPMSLFTKPKSSEPIPQRNDFFSDTKVPDKDERRADALDESENVPEEQPDDVDESEEKTIVLKKAPPLTPPHPRPSTPSEPPDQSSSQFSLCEPPHAQKESSPRPVTPVRPQSASQAATPSTERKSKLRITSDTERIVVCPSVLNNIMKWLISIAGEDMVHDGRYHHAWPSVQRRHRSNGKQATQGKRDHVCSYLHLSHKHC